jgi:hypothetical protein
MMEHVSSHWHYSAMVSFCVNFPSNYRQSREIVDLRLSPKGC